MFCLISQVTPITWTSVVHRRGLGMPDAILWTSTKWVSEQLASFSSFSQFYSSQLTCVCVLGVYGIFVCVERYEWALGFPWSRADHAKEHSASWGLGAPGSTQSLWVLPGVWWLHYIKRILGGKIWSWCPVNSGTKAHVLLLLSAHGHGGRADNPLWWNWETLCSITLFLRWISEAW